MVSERQLVANRANAQLSPGPRTETGKAVVSLNRLKHGLLSERALLPDEDPDALEGLRDAIYRELRPVGELEAALTDRIVAQLWRLRRVLRIETEMLADGGRLDESLGRRFAILAVNHDTISPFVRYETSIERGLFRALHELERRQAARMGQKVVAPVAIDVDISGR